MTAVKSKTLPGNACRAAEALEDIELLKEDRGLRSSGNTSAGWQLKGFSPWFFLQQCLGFLKESILLKVLKAIYTYILKSMGLGGGTIIYIYTHVPTFL